MERLLTAGSQALCSSRERFCVSLAIFSRHEHNHDPHSSDEEIERQHIKNGHQAAKRKTGLNAAWAEPEHGLHHKQP